MSDYNMENLMKVDLKMHTQCNTRYRKHCCTGSWRDIQKCFDLFLYFYFVFVFVYFVL